MLMKELATFTLKDLRTACTVMKVLGTKVENLDTYIASMSKSEQPSASTGKKSTSNQSTKKKGVLLLKSGESESMTGVSCSKCNSTVYIEGVCMGNKIVKQGYTRNGLCGSCGNNFLIR